MLVTLTANGDLQRRVRQIAARRRRRRRLVPISLRLPLTQKGLRDEAAAEIGREQPGSLHELIGHDYGDGFGGQQANEN
jgi:hypothetical protein